MKEYFDSIRASGDLKEQTALKIMQTKKRRSPGSMIRILSYAAAALIVIAGSAYIVRYFMFSHSKGAIQSNTCAASRDLNEIGEDNIQQDPASGWNPGSFSKSFSSSAPAYSYDNGQPGKTEKASAETEKVQYLLFEERAYMVEERYDGSPDFEFIASGKTGTLYVSVLPVGGGHSYTAEIPGVTVYYRDDSVQRVVVKYNSVYYLLRLSQG